MVCFRSRRLAAGLFMGIVVLGACKKDEAKPGGGTTGTSAASNKDLDMIPADSDVVLGVDLAQAQQSAVFRDLVLPLITKSGEAQTVIGTLKAKCNIDPLAAATKLTAGLKLEGRNGHAVVVLHGLEKAKALPCLDQVKEELAAQRLEAVKDGDVVLLKGPDGALGFTFTGDTTAVVVLHPAVDKDRVLAAAQGKSTLKSSAEFNDMYSRLQTSHTVWALVRGDTPMLAGNLGRLGVRSKGVFGSVNLTDGLELHSYLRTESEEQATNLVELAKSQAGPFTKMVEKFEIDRDKNDVRAVAKLTQAQLKSVIGLAQSLSGGFR